VSLVDKIIALAAAIRDKLNAMTPRLLPAGGASGNMLHKTSATDYAVAWVEASPKITTGATPPASPAVGDIWIETP
jgi:hypothetical protein